MFCTNCGNQLSDEAKFCPSCGEKILTAAPSETEEVKAETKEAATTEEAVAEEVKEEAQAESVAEEAKEETKEETASESTEKRKIFDSTDTPKTVIQIVAVVLGFSFLGIFCSNFIGGIFGAIGNVFSLRVVRLIANLLKAATGAAAGGIAILFTVMVLRWEKEKADDFLISLASLGIFGILVKFIACLISSLMGAYINTWKSFGELAGLVIVSVAVVFGVFKAFAIPALENLDSANIKDVVTNSLLNVYNDAREEALNLKAHQDAKKEAEAQFNAEQAASGVTSTTGRPFVPLDTNRSLVKLILLNIITCGIYSWIFTYKLTEDVNVACDGDGDNTAGLVALIVLSTITCGIYGFVWYYKLGNRLQVNARRYGMEFTENGTTVLLWMLLGSWLCGFGAFFALHIIIKNTNLLCAAYNNYNAQAQ